MSLCLLLIIIKPNGLIDFDQFEGTDRIVAQAEGAANCTSRLKLKTNEKYILESICFGIEKSKGEYKIIKDTIYFKRTTRNSFNAKFALLKIMKLLFIKLKLIKTQCI